jgi:hypothetical protein
MTRTPLTNEHQRIAQQVMFYKPIGYRDIGLRRRRWEDTF